MTINVTPRAQDRITFEAILGNKPAMLRLGVKGSGCNGLSYVIEWCIKARASDEISVIDDVTIVVDPKSAVILSGVTLDWETKNLLEYGFKFVNPNAKTTCGCGTSFNV